MINIDYQDRRPIYEQIVDGFELLIIRGILEPDAQMPSVRQLALELSINPNTIQKAYAILEQRGFIYPVKGRGNFVRSSELLVQQKRSLWLDELRKCLEEGRSYGVDYRDCLRELNTIYRRSGND